MCVWKNLLQQTLGAEDVIQTYEKIARDLEQNLGMLSGSPLQALLQQLLDHVLQCRTAVRDINCAIALLQVCSKNICGFCARPFMFIFNFFHLRELWRVLWKVY